MSGVRTLVTPVGFFHDANVQPRHPADTAAWIWHPDCRLGETVFLRFSLKFEMDADATIRVHVTADQRFQFRVDGSDTGFGPDRGDVEKWPVATYELPLRKGTHRLEALVWWLKDETLPGLRTDVAAGGIPAGARLRPPVAQASWRGGFLLAGEGDWRQRLNTGLAAWQVEDLTPAVTAVQPMFQVYHDIGPGFHMNGAMLAAPGRARAAEVVVGGIAGNVHGVQRPGWRLHPTSLPEQELSPVRSGRVRAIAHQCTAGPFDESDVNAGESAAWAAIFEGVGEITFPAGSARTVLWDFEDYVCGYAWLGTRGGRGANMRIDWAESLYESAPGATLTKDTRKGRRDEVQGKVMFGFGDEFCPCDGVVEFPAWWWRSGRYLRVQVSTGDEPLTLTSLRILSTGYPLGEAAGFVTDDSGINRLVRQCDKTIRACAHEVWVDCPYYEQVAYVGDSRLAGLNSYALFPDDRLSRRMLELFDDSRRVNGLVAERAPASWQQVSVTYSLFWVLMVRDFAWWRNDAAFVRERLRGVRAMLDEVLALADAGGLLRELPGWSFVDWVPAWNEGCGPGVRQGDSCIVNLHLLLALRTHAELERAFGESELAALAARRADALEQAILARYWCARRGLLADTGGRDFFSEHAQALGILAGVKPSGGMGAWVEAWLASSDLAQATLYFSHYVLDALHLAGRDDALHARLQRWREPAADGLLTLPETPEPTRSDCHGWGAHVRWHFAASVAGVRPAAPGFALVEVAPQPGAWRVIEAEVCHPGGRVRVEFKRAGGRLRGKIDLPAGVAGEMRWQGARLSLRSGPNPVDLPDRPDSA
jgi:alpha-L-rhamnosidase